MIRATTPLHTFVFTENPETGFSKILITYKQSNRVILEKDKDDLQFRSETVSGVTTYYAYYRLTQAETNLFMARVPVALQLRGLTTNGEAFTSKIFLVTVRDVLNDEVISNGG